MEEYFTHYTFFRFKISHIFIKKNACAHRLANAIFFCWLWHFVRFTSNLCLKLTIIFTSFLISLILCLFFFYSIKCLYKKKHVSFPRLFNIFYLTIKLLYFVPFWNNYLLIFYNIVNYLLFNFFYNKYLKILLKK